MSSNLEMSGLLTRDERNQLLQVASDSIRHGLQHGKPLVPDAQAYPPTLQALRACFVTLELNGELRGCVGSLDAVRPLVQDVAENAYAAAFRDHRFTPLPNEELSRLDIHLSILSPLEKMHVQSEADLLAQIRPGLDGLLIETGWNRGTFLPSVWESLPNRDSFLKHLKNKAGLPIDFWSDDLIVYRYTTEMIP